MKHNHHEEAAKYHTEAHKNYQGRNNEQAAHHAQMANGHSVQAI